MSAPSKFQGKGALAAASKRRQRITKKTDENLLNRSMEAGETVADLLQNVRSLKTATAVSTTSATASSRRTTVTKSQQLEQPPSQRNPKDITKDAKQSNHQPKETRIEIIEFPDPRTPDASMVELPASIQLLSRLTLRTLTRRDESNSLINGSGIGKPYETLTLQMIFASSTDSQQQYVCFGDRIAIQHEHLRLGVSHDENTNEFSVSFAPESSSKSQQWVVLPVQTVPVGTAAKEQDTARRIHQTPGGPPLRYLRDGILLRNAATGAILSVGPDDTLELIADATFQEHVATLDPDEFIQRDRVPSALTRLRRNDELVPSDAQVFYLLQPSAPLPPGWALDPHSYLDGSYLSDPDRHEAWPSLPSLPPTESVLLDELIGACLGLEGTSHVKMDSSHFHLYSNGDRILRSLAQELVPIASATARVQAFCLSRTPGYEYGLVIQAFCETATQMLRDHMTHVLDWHQRYQAGTLTMQELRLLARPAAKTVAVLDQACRCVASTKGGALLNALRCLKLQKYQGDRDATAVVDRLLVTAAVPYITWLRQWLERGRLENDALQEFMVRPVETTEWENQYELVPNNVLDGFLASDKLLEQVVTTGRYWNAVVSCHSSQGGESSDETQLSYFTEPSAVALYVEQKYQEATGGLVRILIDEKNLLGSLRIMKHFFLLEYGDFYVDFLDKAEDELLRSLDQLSRNRVQNWINSSLLLMEHRGDCEAMIAHQSLNLHRQEATPTGLQCRFSTEGLAGHLDKLHAASGGIDPHEPWTPARHAYGSTSLSSRGGLTGLDTFYLAFRSIPYPTSLILSPRAIECYQLLFRHLFFAKHVERRLVSIWRDHQALKELQSLRGSMGPTFLLRQRMMHFVHNLIYYMMCEVIEPNWLTMEKEIFESNKSDLTVDDIIKSHNHFLHRALEACLLTNRDLVRALTKLMKTCLLFTEQMKRFMKATKIDEERRTVATEMQKVVQHNLNARGRQRKGPSKFIKENIQTAVAERQKRVHRQSARVNREVSGDSYQRMVTRFDEVFSKNLREFMVQLTSSDDLYRTHKVNLCIRLDYNGFVTNSLGLS